MKFKKNIEITEVCPRDGWQNHRIQIPTETKIELIKKMIDCGPKSIEITSFVNPKAVPQMADSVQVVEGIMDYANERDVDLLALTLNKRGVDNARAVGIKNVEFVLSVSEEHNMRNTRKTITESLEDFKRLSQYAQDLNIILCLPCVFGSPFGDEISLELVISLCEEAKNLGVKTFGLADTAGISNPYHTRKVLQYLKQHIDVNQISMHLHDTRGMGLANAYVALEEGISRFDTSLGAMGGCPFVPGAKGNIGTEDLVNMVEKIGLETTYDLEKTINLSLEMGQMINCNIISSMANLCK